MKLVLIGSEKWRNHLAGVAESSGHEVDASDPTELKERTTATQFWGGVDIIIEYANLRRSARRQLLVSMDQLAPAGALLMVSALTSSVAQSATHWSEPENVVGFGLLPPFDDQMSIELAVGMNSASLALSKARVFWQRLGYQPELVADGPALVRARILCNLINEAASALMEGVAEADDIDRAMRLGTNYPLGPLRWADQIGLDVVLNVMNGLFDEWGEDRYRPTPLLRRLVQAGRLGQKSGRGFYDYS